MILSNQVICSLCGDRPYSMSGHHFNTCECGNVSVDGGMEYLRRVYETDEWTDISIEWEDDLCEEIIAELDRMKESGRNSLGMLCAVARVMRDYELDI